jgi:hypothetical protein
MGGRREKGEKRREERTGRMRDESVLKWRKKKNI